MNNYLFTCRGQFKWNKLLRKVCVLLVFLCNCSTSNSNAWKPTHDKLEMWWLQQWLLPVATSNSWSEKGCELLAKLISYSLCNFSVSCVPLHALFPQGCSVIILRYIGVFASCFLVAVCGHVRLQQGKQYIKENKQHKMQQNKLNRYYNQTNFRQNKIF
jgi:hypothetical protein